VRDSSHLEFLSSSAHFFRQKQQSLLFSSEIPFSLTSGPVITVKELESFFFLLLPFPSSIPSPRFATRGIGTGESLCSTLPPLPFRGWVIRCFYSSPLPPSLTSSLRLPGGRSGFSPSFSRSTPFFFFT